MWFYNFLKKSNKLIKLQKEKLKNENVKWLKNLDKLQNKPTIFFGNEFLDALPIKQFINFKGNWYERYVQKHKGVFNFTKVKCNMERVENKIKLKLSKNQNFLEISFEEIKIIKKLNNIIKKIMDVFSLLIMHTQIKKCLILSKLLKNIKKLIF